LPEGLGVFDQMDDATEGSVRHSKLCFRRKNSMNLCALQTRNSTRYFVDWNTTEDASAKLGNPRFFCKSNHFQEF
jgi:hypothetical protein